MDERALDALLELLATASATDAKAALDEALVGPLTDDELRSIGKAVLARRDKLPRNRLVRHLADLDGPVRTELLRLASDTTDTAFAAKVQRLLRDGEEAVAGEAAAYTSAGGWTREPAAYQPASFQPYAADEGGLTRLRAAVDGRSDLTTDAAYLDVVVRFGHTSIERLQAAVGGGPVPSFFSPVRTPYLLYQWVRTGQRRRDDRPPDGGLRINVEPGRFSGRPAPVAASHRFTDRLIEEVLGRLGTIDELLSTPTHVDGSLDIAVFAERVRRAREVDYGRYDLVQALLRLGPVEARDVERFAGLRLPNHAVVVEAQPPAPLGAAAPTAQEESPGWLDRLAFWRGDRQAGESTAQVKDRKAAGLVDGVDVITAWILAGGAHQRRTTLTGGFPMTSPIRLPLLGPLARLEGLEGISAGCSPGDSRASSRMADPGSWLSVCPWDTEQLGAMLARRSDLVGTDDALELAPIARCAGPLGIAMHHALAVVLAHPDKDCRAEFARQVATLAMQGRVDPELLRDRSVWLFGVGRLPLARTASAWAEVARLSSWTVVWPAWFAVLDAACSQPNRPTGLAELLRITLQAMPFGAAGAPPDPLPESVRQLAAQGGRSASVRAAKALVAQVSG